MLSVKKSIIFFLFLSLWGYAWAQEMERILNYDVYIEIGTDRSITVTEDIQVVVLGQEIKRGITRSLPLKRNFQGRNQWMNYQDIQITRDGRPEDHHTATSGDEEVLYIGKEDVFLNPGTYAYTIPAFAVDDRGIEYTLQAQDQNGLISTSPDLIVPHFCHPP